jgi:hypothetical protein
LKSIFDNLVFEVHRNHKVHINIMQTYKGGCHCGKVRYEVDMVLDKVCKCNCSHCAIKGFLLAFVPAAQFRLLSGEEDLTEYRFNKKAIQHLFCKHCGVQSFGKGDGPQGATVMINARCLEGVDADALPSFNVDGKSM